MRDQHVGPRPCHRDRRGHVEDVWSRDHAARRRGGDHLHLEVVTHAGLLEVVPKGAVVQAHGREVLDTRETSRLDLAQEDVHQPEWIRPTHSGQNGRVVDDREHLARHLHDDGVRVAVRQQSRQRSAACHPVSP